MKINFNSPYCSWTTQPVGKRGRKHLTLFNTPADVKRWLRSSDADNARRYGITAVTAARVTRTLVAGGRTMLNASRLLNKQLGL